MFSLLVFQTTVTEARISGLALFIGREPPWPLEKVALGASKTVLFKSGEVPVFANHHILSNKLSQE